MHILDTDVTESLEQLHLIIDKLALIVDDRLRKELESIDFIQKMLKEAEDNGYENGAEGRCWCDE